MDADYLLGCDVMGLEYETIEDPNMGQPAVYIQGGGGGGGKGGGGGGHGGHGHGGHGHGHGGPGWGGPGWGWGGYGYPLVYDIEPELEYAFVEGALHCVKRDGEGNCLESVPVDVAGIDAFEVLGEFDIGKSARQFAALKQVPVSVARVLLDGGMKAINDAINFASSHSLHDGGDKRRNDIMWKLRWHADALSKLQEVPPETIYEHGADLKNFVAQSFVQYNAAEQGANEPIAAKAWGDYISMWNDVAVAISKLPAKVAKAVSDMASEIVVSATGLPIWGWFSIGVAGLGILGFFFYKILNTQAAGAAAGAVSHAYLGRR